MVEIRHGSRPRPAGESCGVLEIAIGPISARMRDDIPREHLTGIAAALLEALR